MSAKELFVIIFGTLTLLAVVLGLMFFALIYLNIGSGDGSTAHVECSEEDFSGLCGIKKFFRGERSGSASITTELGI